MYILAFSVLFYIYIYIFPLYVGSPSFLKELIEHDKDNISATALRKVEKYVKKPEFNSNIVGKVSIAAKSLSIWVRSMYMYGEIYK